MKIINIYPILIGLFFSVLIVSCTDEINTTTEIDTPTYEPVEIIITSLNGIITDDNGTPLSNVLLSITNAQSLTTTETDDNGYYEIIEAEVRGPHAHVSISSLGTFDGEYKVSVAKSEISKADFKVKPLEPIGTFESSVDATVSQNDKITIQFTKNSISRADGSSYEGEVEVFVNNIEPYNQNVRDHSFGGYQGENKAFTKGAIFQHQTVQVELKSPSGELLNIKDGSTAKVTVRSQDNASSSLLSEEISMMHFDQIEGIWKEESNGNFDGNKWEADLPHFSTWSWCTFFENTEDGNGLIQLTADNVPYHSTSYVLLDYGNLSFLTPTLSDGTFEFIFGLLDIPFTFTVLNDCEESIYSEDFSSIPTDGNFGHIAIDSPENSTNKLSVSVFNCDETPVEVGYSRFCIDDLDYQRCQLIPIIDGFVEYGFLSCMGDLTGELFLLNEDNLMTTQPINVNLNEGDVIIDQVSLCDTFNNNITININGTHFLSSHVIHYGGQLSGNGDKSQAIGSDNGSSSFNMGIMGPFDNPGIYPLEFFSIGNEDSTIITLQFDPDMTFNLEEFEPNETDPNNFFLFPAHLKASFGGIALEIDPVTNEVIGSYQVDGTILID